MVMTPKDLAFIGCRLLALYVLYGVVLTLAHTVSAFAQYLTNPGSGIGQYALANGVSLAGNVIVFLALWCGAGRIAGEVAAGTGAPPQEPSQAWTRHDALSLALVVLGLWVLVQSLPSLLALLPLLIPDPEQKLGFSIRLESLISGVLTVLFGLICVLRGRAIAAFIARLRHW
jgi:hypothetical protein